MQQQLKEHFTMVNSKILLSLTTTYSMRLYEIFTQYLQVGEYCISVDRFRDMLCLNDKQDLSSIIDPALGELNTKSDLDVRYAEEKTGEKITKLWFYFNEKSQS